MKIIYFAIALVCLFLAQFMLVYSEPAPNELKKMAGGVRKKCLSATGANVDVVDDAELGEFPEDQKLKCYLSCVLETFNMITKDKKLNIGLMRKIIPEQFKMIGNDMLDSCQHISGYQDNCELAFAFNKCLFEANPVAYFVV
ncbi:hypothetical protein KM043_014126 [Ampulex compressa]|nr:hypothetical protein KM043_014126 [Ampulex compressa]